MNLLCIILLALREHFTHTVTISVKELQHFAFFSAFTVFEQGGIFIVPYLLCYDTESGVFEFRTTGPLISRLLR